MKTCVALQFKISVPDFQVLMLPLLRTAENDEEHSLAEAGRALAAERPGRAVAEREAIEVLQSSCLDDLRQKDAARERCAVTEP